LHDARGPENDEWLTARRLGRVLEGVHEHRQLTPVIRVEMGQDNVRHLMPGQPELGEPVQRARAAIEQHAQLAARHPVTGAGAAAGGTGGRWSRGRPLERDSGSSGRAAWTSVYRGPRPEMIPGS